MLFHNLKSKPKAFSIQRNLLFYIDVDGAVKLFYLIAQLILLACGKCDTLTYLFTFTAMILAHFVTRIAMIPTFWLTFSLLLNTDRTSSLVITMGLVSIVVDMLNLYWLARMIHTYIKFYSDEYNFVRIFKRKLS